MNNIILDQGSFITDVSILQGVGRGNKFLAKLIMHTLISLINVEVGINVEGVQKMQNH